MNDVNTRKITDDDIEDGYSNIDVEKTQEAIAEIYLEVRNLISDSLRIQEEVRRVEVLDVCVGMDKDGKAKEFGITCEYKGMPVCLKGMIGAAA